MTFLFFRSFQNIQSFSMPLMFQCNRSNQLILPSFQKRMMMMGRDSHEELAPGGRIETIVGPMFSGKTTELFRRMRRLKLSKRQVITVKYAEDQRYHEKHAATHDLVTEEALSCHHLSESLPILMTKDVICIDEGHFFGDLAVVADQLANAGKIVIVAALDADFRREPFPEVSRLIAKSELVNKLDSVCSVCHKKAAFSKRITDEQELHLVGGREKYQCVCRNCYYL